MSHGDESEPRRGSAGGRRGGDGLREQAPPDLDEERGYGHGSGEPRGPFGGHRPADDRCDDEAPAQEHEHRGEPGQRPERRRHARGS